MLVDKNILYESSGYYSKIRYYKDLYTHYIGVLKSIYGEDEWQEHIGFEVVKKALNGKMTAEECNERYSKQVANLLLTDCRYKKVLEKVYKSIDICEETEEAFKRPRSKSGDAKYACMRYWEYLPEYFYEYQSRYGCNIDLEYQKPSGVVEDTFNYKESYRDIMREAIADFLDDPINKQVKEQLYDDYKYYADNCAIRSRSKSYLANTIWDKGKLYKGNPEDLECYKYIKVLNPYAMDKEPHKIVRVAHKVSADKMDNFGVALRDVKDLACLRGEKDIYISQNIFSKHGSYTKDNVAHLNAMYVDIDYYNTKFGNLEPEVMAAKLKLLKFSGDTSIPEPSLYISSGRGLYLIWLLDRQYNKDTYSNERYWNNLEALLVNQFKDCGSDMAVKDTTRILRLLGSINSKTGKVVRVIAGDLDNPKRYKMDYLYNAVKNYEEQVVVEQAELKSNKRPKKDASKSAPNPSKTRKREGLGTSVSKMRSVFLNRVYDLEQVVEYRRINGCIGIGETGWRDKLLFLHCLYNCYAGNTVDYAINKALELNKKLSIPLKEHKLTSKKNTLEKARNAYFGSIKNRGFRVQDDGVYRYTTSKIIEMIGLTDEEQDNIELITLVNQEIKRSRKKLKDAERYQNQLKARGEKPKKDKIVEMCKKIKVLLESGMTQKEIAEKLGVSLRTVQRRVKELQNENIVEFREVDKTTEDKSITTETTHKEKREMYADSFVMSNPTGFKDYSGFGEQTVG